MLARAHCLRLLEHLARAAASRTFWTAGSNSPIRMAMIAITTSSSISVNAVRPRRRGGRGESGMGDSGLGEGRQDIDGGNRYMSPGGPGMQPPGAPVGERLPGEPR